MKIALIPLPGKVFDRPITITFEPREVAVLHYWYMLTGGQPSGPRGVAEDLGKILGGYYPGRGFLPNSSLEIEGNHSMYLADKWPENSRFF